MWSWTGDAFGVGSPTGSATVNIRMPGQYVDAESGLFYNWNRYYNPAIGRYISSDPIGIDGGLNTFLYAEASPVMYVDPEGLKEVAYDFIGPLQPGDRRAARPLSLSSCLATCAGELVRDMTVVEGASLIAATPVPKSWVGQSQAMGARKLTNIGGALATLGRNLPRLKNPILATTNACRVASRANAYVGAAFATYDSAALLSCSAICFAQGGLK